MLSDICPSQSFPFLTSPRPNHSTYLCVRLFLFLRLLRESLSGRRFGRLSHPYFQSRQVSESCIGSIVLLFCFLNMASPSPSSTCPLSCGVLSGIWAFLVSSVFILLRVVTCHTYIAIRDVASICLYGVHEITRHFRCGPVIQR
jgi:hypothetical protein